MLALADALRWMERLIGVAIALASIELLGVRDALRDDGVFRWSTLRRDHESAPRWARAVLDHLLAHRPFLRLLSVQLALAATLVALPHPLLPPALLCTTTLVSLRFRGSYNGGSDFMTAAVLLSLCIARVSGSELGARLGLGYAAAQLVLSYFVAGTVKLRRRAWWSGEALRRLARAPQYAVPAWIAVRLDGGSLARTAGIAVIALECAFPLALVHPAVCRLLLSLAALFHLVNAHVLGLNRFLWAWLAAYPALMFWAG